MSFTNTTMHLSARRTTNTSSFVINKNKDANWVIEQLHIHRHQHILEVGFKNGRLLHGTAERLGNGFIAGIDESVEMYKLALRKNRPEIESQLMQLHLGTISELPYPAYYFDTIYGYNIYSTWKKPENVFMQLHRLLKTGGRFVLFFEIPSTLSELPAADPIDIIKQQFTEAGFSEMQISYADNSRSKCVSVTGFKL